MKNISKKWLVIIILVIILAIALGVYLGVELNSFKANNQYSPYSIVYLTNGSIYFGRLSLFPWPSLKDVYSIQQDQKTGQYSLISFSSSFIKPANEIYLNPKEIIFWARLKSDSPVAQAITAEINGQESQLYGDNTNQAPSSTIPNTTTSSILSK
jgi:hypothetical protein